MPAKKRVISVWENADAVANAAAHAFVQDCNAAIVKKGIFSIALSGGNTPAAFFRKLAEPAFSRNIPWDKVHLFWSDERWVAHDHPDSNYRMAKENLLDHVPLIKSHIHPVPVKGKPASAANGYEKSIRRILSKSKGAFDWIMLGLGNDGHTASLFPGTAILSEKKKWVDAVWVEEKQTFRISFTYPLINNAGKVIFLVTGAEKASVVKDILNLKPSLPATAVHPTNGKLQWFIDQAAAGDLKL